MSETLASSCHRPEEPLDRSIVSLIFDVARHLATTIDRRVAPFNVTGQQAALLLRCCMAPHLTPTQLAPWLGTDNAGITRLVERLEAKGLATRRMSASDRRAVMVEPTEAGRDLVPHLKAAFEEVRAHLLEGFTPEDLPQVQSTLQRLLQNLEPHECGDAPGRPVSARAYANASAGRSAG